MACGCNGKEAGFFDSGPYTPIANARFDGLGPGVREAGAATDEQRIREALAPSVGPRGPVTIPETTVEGYTQNEKLFGFVLLAGAVAAIFYWSKR